MRVDPLASMRCWAVDLAVGQRVFTIPARPAADWWPVLTGASAMGALDLVESQEIDDLLMSGEIGLADLNEVLTEAIEETAGRSFHAAIVLAAVAEQNWPMVGGALARRGFRWDVAPLGAALDAVYFTVVEGLEEKVRQRFEAILDNESLTTAGKSERARDRALDDFSAMAGPRPTTGVRSSGVPSDSARSRTRTQHQQHLQDGPSAGPMPPPALPAESAPPASSARRAGAAEPASGTGPHPPLAGRSRPRSRSAAPGSGPAPSK